VTDEGTKLITGKNQNSQRIRKKIINKPESWKAKKKQTNKKLQITR